MKRLICNFCLYLLFPALGWAECFDFNQKIIQPIREPIPLVAGKDNEEVGKDKKDRAWASLRGEVKKPISSVLGMALDHENTKGQDVKEFKVEQIKSPHYLERHVVDFLVQQFIKVRWKEDWAFALAEGEANDPKSIVVSYQKTQGTSFIKHLCGVMVLRKLSVSSTDVFQYEEVIATGRSEKDTLEGLKIILKKLRG